jgi:Flp pilus assembly protein TadG
MRMKRRTKKFLKFLGHQNGAMSILTAITIVPLLLAAGTAIDFARLNAAQTQLQMALDAATLSGASAKGKTTAQRISTAQQSFDINAAHVMAGTVPPVAHFDVVGGVMVATASFEVPTALMRLAGIDTMESKTRSEVNILADKKAEIVLVLDYSGSMDRKVDGKVKYKIMREAASKLVTDLSKSDPDNIKFGLVPFSHHVYTTLPGGYVVGGKGTWKGCTQDRKYPFNISDATPTDDPGSLWNQPMYGDDADQLKYGCGGYVANNLEIVDLTDKFKKITRQLEIMTPYAYTHIALGVEFGYHVLSPNAPYTEGASFSDDDTKKFMVVLTDGEQTTGAFGETSRTVADGDKNLGELCKNAKANKITMMTMAFDLDHAPTLERLQACASDPTQDFFVAKDADALASAFERIKSAVTAEIVLRK